MMWRRPQNHRSDCYFCLCITTEYNNKNKSTIKYPNVSLVSFPIVIDKPTVVKNAKPNKLLENQLDVDLKNTSKDSASDGNSFCKESTSILFNQLTLNDLVLDLYLFNQLSELLAQRK